MELATIKVKYPKVNDMLLVEHATILRDVTSNGIRTLFYFVKGDVRPDDFKSVSSATELMEVIPEKPVEGTISFMLPNSSAYEEIEKGNK
jgi:hypothetical protein